MNNRKQTRLGRWGMMGLAWALCSGVAQGGEATRPSYAVVVSQATQADPGWRQVVDALRDRHQARIVEYQGSVTNALPDLRQIFPRYAAFVATPAEAGRAFVADVHRLTRQLDDDPYTDVLWGIVTGYDAANALRIARQTEPLTIQRVASGTEVALDRGAEGVWYCELVKNRKVRKKAGEPPREETGPDDTTRALVETLNDYQAQLFVTSGHATERDWQIGYRYANGQFVSQAGRLFGVDTARQRYPIQSPNPKVYLPVGNCLMGHINGPDAMALAFLNSAGVCQMIGYTVPTWYGYAGWGCLDYFLEQPGRYTFAEAVLANHQALLHRLETCFPELARAHFDDQARRPSGPLSAAAKKAGLTWNDAQGLLFDRDVLAFYGDPAWEARMADGPLSWRQSLTESAGLFVWELQPLRGAESFAPVNRNGSQRGGRPFVQWFPRRIKGVKLIEDFGCQAVITDNFLLVPNPGRVEFEPGLRVVFRAEWAE